MKTSRTTVSQQVVDYLKANIARQAWNVGQKIPSENRLTRDLGVSRASVRLAIQQFIALGILESVHGKGTFLRASNADAFNTNLALAAGHAFRDVAKVLEFRLLLEPQACFWAAENAPAGLAEQLRKLLHAQMAAIGRPEEFIARDVEFHLAISEASGNPLLHQALRGVFEQRPQNQQQINSIFGFKDGIYYHSLILKAFESGNPRDARRHMAEHLQNALDLIARQQPFEKGISSS